MKKLLALLVIIAFTASIVVAVDNPFDFSLSNEIRLKATDQSQMGRKSDDNDYISESPVWDYVVVRAVIFDEMNCSASHTFGDIYTLGAFLKGRGEIGFIGDSDRVEFRTGWQNGIQAVQDYLKIDIDIEFRNQWDDFEHVDYFLIPSFKLSGEVPDSGFDWSLKQSVEMGFNPEYWKDSDPTYQTFDTPAYDQEDGAIGNDVPYEQRVVFDYAKFETELLLNFELFHFFAPENITGTIKLKNVFKATIPYSSYLERSKTLGDEFQAGFELGLAGPTIFLALWGETTDFVNTSAPLDGDYGSYRAWDGTWIGNIADDKEEADDMEDASLSLWSGDWSDYDAHSHARPNLNLGFKLEFSYTKEWFSFGTAYKGFATGLRRYDEDGCNDQLGWINEFDIYVKFEL
jgi:hypothetical protein